MDYIKENNEICKLHSLSLDLAKKILENQIKGTFKDYIMNELKLQDKLINYASNMKKDYESIISDRVNTANKYIDKLVFQKLMFKISTIIFAIAFVLKCFNVI